MRGSAKGRFSALSTQKRAPLRQPLIRPSATFSPQRTGRRRSMGGIRASPDCPGIKPPADKASLVHRGPLEPAPRRSQRLGSAKPSNTTLIGAAEVLARRRRAALPSWLASATKPGRSTVASSRVVPAAAARSATTVFQGGSASSPADIAPGDRRTVAGTTQSMRAAAAAETTPGTKAAPIRLRSAGRRPAGCAAAAPRPCHKAASPATLAPSPSPHARRVSLRWLCAAA